MIELLDDILAVARPVAEICTPGVYFLIQGNRLVYVGISVSCESRINMHRTEGIEDFDRFTIVRIDDPAKRRQTESELIETFRPFYNRADLRQYGLAPKQAIPEACDMEYSEWEAFVKKHKIPYKYATGARTYYRIDAVEAALQIEKIYNGGVFPLDSITTIL